MGNTCAALSCVLFHLNKEEAPEWSKQALVIYKKCGENGSYYKRMHLKNLNKLLIEHVNFFDQEGISINKLMQLWTLFESWGYDKYVIKSLDFLVKSYPTREKYKPDIVDYFSNELLLKQREFEEQNIDIVAKEAEFSHI